MSSSSQPDVPPPRLAPRAVDGHKGSYGRALLIGGSRGMAGAIALAGIGALRGGAGLVQLALPDVCQDTVAAVEPSYMTLGLPADDQGRISGVAREPLEQAIGNATALVCGPGLGQSADLADLVQWLYATVSAPMVVDADALNLLAARGEGLPSPGGVRILTPHPGEFARLSGHSAKEIQARREDLASRFAAAAGVVLVLKGHGSVVTDGTKTAVNQTGNPGMATGGTGDVLTGVLTALLCQGLAPYEAARLAVHVHGLAGDLAAKEQGQVGMIASDLARFLPAAMRTVVAES